MTLWSHELLCAFAEYIIIWCHGQCSVLWTLTILVSKSPAPLCGSISQQSHSLLWEFCLSRHFSPQSTFFEFWTFILQRIYQSHRYTIKSVCGWKLFGEKWQKNFIWIFIKFYCYECRQQIQQQQQQPTHSVYAVKIIWRIGLVDKVQAS